jgi:glucose/arabinose dehydrogenase
MRASRFYWLRILLLWSLVLMGCDGGGDGSSGVGSSPSPAAVQLQTVRTGLSALVFLTAPPTDTARLFVVEQAGRIQILDRATGTQNAAPFLDISAQIASSGEQGLLGLAFHPNYDANRQFYVYYTDPSGNPTVARYLRHSTNPNLADPLSAVVLVSVPHPGASKHNGGMLAFGPDGCLYAATGDGGTGGAPAQDTSSLLGKILRLNPDAPGPPASCTNAGQNPFGNQVWSYGLRNPWRFSFDRGTNDLYIADVGESTREEVNVATGAQAGLGVNYGWNIMEGSLCIMAASCNQAGLLTPPVLDYPHGNGAFCGGSIIGGYVYRGSAISGLQGTYFYGDFCLQFVKSFQYQSGQAANQANWPSLQPTGNITSFGEDAHGELYVVTNLGGVYRIVP